jgi:Protein of unknown function (DUF742)
VTRGSPKPDGTGRDARERLVRPYALTAGRTQPTGTQIDVIALVSAARAKPADFDPATEQELGPEHLRLLRLCRRPVPVADLATRLDLPLGVIRILISDLRERGLVNIAQPKSSGLGDLRVLKEVADALRRL